MTDFETSADDAKLESDDEQQPFRERFGHYSKFFLRRLVVLLSFGPGILGVLWLLGRIIRR